MSSIGSGYDLYTTSYSPDGRIFQVEYATKAVDNSSTAAGIRCKDGVVLAVEKLVVSKLLVAGTNRRIHTLDMHAGIAVAGLTADARPIVQQSRGDCSEYKSFYGEPMPGKLLADRMAYLMHLYTQYWSLRPFGVSLLLAAHDTTGNHLYMMDPSGQCHSYYGIAIGKGRQAARVELEKLNLKEMTCRQAVLELAKIIHSVHDEVKDKDFELEMSWVCEESKFQHQLVPRELRDEADRQAKAAIEAAMEE